MKQNESDIVRIEEINDANIRLHFADGSTLRMARRTFESGSWKRGTDARIVQEING